MLYNAHKYSIIFSQTEYLPGVRMNKDEKLDKVCKDFSSLKEEQQDYILGILQALVFAKNTSIQSDTEKPSKPAKS